MNCHMNKKTIAITAGAIGAVMILGGCIALVCNSKKMKTARAVKRASRVMYHVGTAMRNISGETENG